MPPKKKATKSDFSLSFDRQFNILKVDITTNTTYIEKPLGIQSLIDKRDLDFLIKVLQAPTSNFELNTIYYPPLDVAKCESPDKYFIEKNDLTPQEAASLRLVSKRFSDDLCRSNPIFNLIGSIITAYKLTSVSEAEAYRNKAFFLIELMIAKGLDISIVSIDGWTPLHYACSISGSEKLVEFLLAKGANVDAKTITCKATPLHHVSYSLQEEKGEAKAELLLKAGANPSSTTSGGKTCIRALNDVNDIKTTNIFNYIIQEHTTQHGYKPAFEIIMREVKNIKINQVISSIIYGMAKVEFKHKIKIKIPPPEVVKIIYNLVHKLNSKLTIEELENIRDSFWFLKDLEPAIISTLDLRFTHIREEKELENEVLKEAQELFNLIAQLSNHGANKKAIKAQIEENKAKLVDLYEALIKHIDNDRISFDISHIESRIEHLNLRLKANKLGTIGDDKATEEAEATSSSDSDGETSAPKKEAEFDGTFSPENLRLLADEFSNSSSRFVATVKEAAYFSEVTEAEEIEANSKLTKILAKLKEDKSPHAKAIKYAQHYLPANLILYFLEESEERAFGQYLSATDEKSHFQAFAEAIEARGGTVEREWTKAGDFVEVLKKIAKGNYIKVTKVEFSNLLQALGFETKGFEEGNLRFHAIHKITGAKVGGHFIHKQDQDRKGEVHIQTLQKLRGILEDDGTLEHYLGHHDAGSVLEAGGAAGGAAAGAALGMDAEEEASVSVAPTNKAESLELFVRILAGHYSQQDISSLPRAYSIIGREMHPDLKDVIENTPGQLNLGNLRKELASILEFFHATEHATVAPDPFHEAPLAGAGGFGAGDGEVPLAGAGGGELESKDDCA